MYMYTCAYIWHIDRILYLSNNIGLSSSDDAGITNHAKERTLTKPFKKKLYLEALDILVSLDLLDYLDHLELLENLESKAFYPRLHKTRTA